MSRADRKGISKILNRTNFRIMAWYFSPKESAQSGLKRVKLACKMPMQSTGKEKFTVYVYFLKQKGMIRIIPGQILRARHLKKAIAIR